MKKSISYFTIYLCLLFSGSILAEEQLFSRFSSNGMTRMQSGEGFKTYRQSISQRNTISLHLLFPGNESLLKSNPDNITRLSTTFYTSITSIRPGEAGFGTDESYIHRYEDEIRIRM